MTGPERSISRNSVQVPLHSGSTSSITVRLWSLTTSAVSTPMAESAPAAVGSDDRRNAQRARQIDRMQTTGAAKGQQRKLARVVTAFDRDAAQRSLHVRVHYREYSLRRLDRLTFRPAALLISLARSRQSVREHVASSSLNSPPSNPRPPKWPSTTCASVTVGSNDRP